MFGKALLRENSLFRNYKNWLLNAKQGAQYIYFTGNALSESIIGQTIGEIVREDAFEGFVYMVQKKRAPFVYEHIAIKAGMEPPLRLIPGTVRKAI